MRDDRGGAFPRYRERWALAAACAYGAAVVAIAFAIWTSLFDQGSPARLLVRFVSALIAVLIAVTLHRKSSKARGSSAADRKFRSR